MIDCYLETGRQPDLSVEPAEGFVEVHDEPGHYHRFENAHVRVYDVRFPPGASSLYHRHSVNTMYVAIHDCRVYDQAFAQQDGVMHALSAGMCGCRPHGREPLIHRVRNDGTGPMQMIGAEHRKSPPVLADRPLAAPFHSALDDPFHGESIRFYRIDLPPGESTGLVDYNFSGLLVSLSDATLAVGDGRGTQVTGFAPGAFVWHDGPIRRQLSNVGKTRFRAVLGEWR